MVAKITTGKDVYGALAYNQLKVDKGVGAVLATHIVREPADGRFCVAATADDLLCWMPSHIRTEKPVIHVSLNPDPEDHLTDEQLVEIAEKYMTRMGWGGQPYIVFKHTDIDREHIHIVSVQVAQDGRKIKDSKRNERSVAVTEELEKEYGLRPAKGQSRTDKWQFIPVDFTAGNLKGQIAAVAKPAARLYKFQTLGEWRALLSLYNIGLEEVQGERNGKPYRGLLYTVLKNGERTASTPIKSSWISREVGVTELERRMERSGKQIANSDTSERTRRRVTQALCGASTEEELRDRLRRLNIDLYLRRNEPGRITGVTFIDHESRCVLNGSRLGKDYSANALERRFGAMKNAGADIEGITVKSPQAQSQFRQRKPRKLKR